MAVSKATTTATPKASRAAVVAPRKPAASSSSKATKPAAATKTSALTQAPPKAAAKTATTSPSAPKAAAKPAARSKGNGSAPHIAPEQRYKMICDAAYFIAERRGFTEGDPMQDWLDAEAEVDALLARKGSGA